MWMVNTSWKGGRLYSTRWLTGGNHKISSLQEKGYVTAIVLQKQLSQNPSFNPLSTRNSFKVRQEPTLSIQKKKNLQNSISRAQNNKNSDDSRRNRESKPYYFCGKSFSPNHRQSCQMKNVSCKSSSKKGHFTKVCNFWKNVDNLDEESEGIADEECNFIMS